MVCPHFSTRMNSCAVTVVIGAEAMLVSNLDLSSADLWCPGSGVADSRLSTRVTAVVVIVIVT